MATRANSTRAELLTVDETCAALNIGRSKFYKLLGAEELPIRRIRLGDHWRFSRQDVERFCHGETTEQMEQEK